MNNRINGLQVYRAGKPENEAIVFIHGFPFDASTWSKQVAALQDDYFCITYDVRGLGASEVGTGQFTMEMFVDDLVSALDSLHIEKAALCGLSMGGYVALRAVERERTRFTKLILCDTRADADDNAGKLKRSANVRKIDDYGVAKFVEDFLPGSVSDVFKRDHATELDALIKRFSAANPVGVKGCQILMMGRYDMTGLLKRIDMPALVLCGEEDAFSPPAVMESMSAHITGSRFVVVPDAGHLAPIENPDFVNRAIREFLSA